MQAISTRLFFHVLWWKWYCEVRETLYCLAGSLVLDLIRRVYRIAGNFRGRKLSRIARLYCAKNATPPNFTNSHKTANFTKVFSLESFPLYGTHTGWGLGQDYLPNSIVFPSPLSPWELWQALFPDASEGNLHFQSIKDRESLWRGETCTSTWE